MERSKLNIKKGLSREDYIVEQYITFRMDPNNDPKKDSIFCTQIGITTKTLDSILNATKMDWKDKVVKLRRDAYKQRMIAVDEALFLKAKSGNIKAIELVYERWDGFNRKIVDNSQHLHFNFSELVKRAEQKPNTRRGTSISEALSEGA